MSRFKNTDTPPSATSSCQPNSPCRTENNSVEFGLDGDPSGEKYSIATSPDTMCPYRYKCDSTAYGMRLTGAYGRDIAVTLVEPVGNIVIRSEQQFSSSESHRIGLRKHIHELERSSGNRCRISEGAIAGFLDVIDRRRQAGVTLNRINWGVLDDAIFSAIEKVAYELREHFDKADDVPEAELFQLFREKMSAYDLSLAGELEILFRNAVTTPLLCHKLRDDDVFGRYLGFVDIRTYSLRSPLAFALLVPPRHIRHDASITCVQGDYGRIFGAHGFMATAYATHEPKVGGAFCAQACIIMVLAMLSDRGSMMLGSFDLTYIGLKQTSARLASVPATHPRTKHLVVYGMNAVEIQETLKKCNIAAEATWSDYSLTRRVIIERVLCAYVESRFPSILLVNSREWSGDETEVGHAVVIVGIKRQGQRVVTLGGSPIVGVSHLIVHDPGQAPFLQRRFEDCMRAASLYPSNGKSAIPIIFASGPNISRHAHDCLDYIETNDPALWERYICKTGDTTESTDFQVALVHKKDIARRFACFRQDYVSTVHAFDDADLLPEEDFWLLNLRLFVADSNVPSTWYWVIAGYDVLADDESDGKRIGAPAIAWIFSSSGDDGEKWDRRILRDENVNELMRLHWRDTE